MRVVFVVGIALAISVPAPAGAQVLRPTLTINAAVAEAFEHNPELIALRADYDASRAAPAQEQFLAPPSFMAEIWGWPVTTLNPARTDWYMFTGEQEIPGRGKRVARTLVGERDADMAKQRVLVRAADIVSDVREAYLDLALARNTLAVYARQVPVLHDMADAATLRYASGRTGQQDTIRAIGEMTRVKAEQITWDERARVASARLNALLARPLDGSVEVESAVATAPELNTAEIERIAVEQHPMIRMADAEIAREEAELTRLKGDRKPDFVVGGGYMLEPGGAGAWLARGGITWPNAPWSRGKLNAQIETQEKRMTAAKARRDAAVVAIKQAVLAASIRVDAAKQREDLLQSTTVPHAEHEFGLARVDYAGARADFNALLDSQRMLLSAEVDGVAAAVDVLRAMSDVSRATGELPEVSR
jgi:cobalt-zinc-cadmium efflux system outer membrane protein